jgi:signal peptidase I
MDAELQERLAQVREQEAQENSKRRKTRIERWILLPILVLLLITYFNTGRVVVQGISMEPTLKTGDSLFFLKSYETFSPLKAGDIVVLQKIVGKLQGEDLIKRVVFIQNAKGNAPWPQTLTVAGQEVQTEILFPAQSKWRTQNYPNAIFVIGDNLSRSIDSREIGPMYELDVLGKVIGNK